jgi:hypothetical protein
MEEIGTIAGVTKEILGEYIIYHSNLDFGKKKMVILIISPGKEGLN